MIVLVNPPSPPGTVSNKDTMGGLGQLYPAATLSKMPPLDLVYCAGVLRKHGVDFEILECLGLSLELDNFVNQLARLSARRVAMRTSLPTLDWDLEVARRSKEKTGCDIVLFGPCLTALHTEALAHPAVDAVLIGEPELALTEVALRGLDCQVPGLLLKGVNRGRSDQPTVIASLDDLPLPAWDLLPYRAYSGTELMNNIHPFVTMLSSRGCVHGCQYCPYPVTQGNKIRYHSVERVIEEMRWLSRELGVRAVMFRDPEFAINRDRVCKICEGIIRNELKLSWRCETRIENLDLELIRLMSRAGCIGINMGIESFDPKVLEMLGRSSACLDHAKSVAAEAHSCGISTFCFFILGLPGETVASSLHTISSAVSIGSDHLQFTAATPYPGTELYRWAVEHGFLLKESRSLLTGYNAVMHNGHLAPDLVEELCEYATKRWSLEQMRSKLRPWDVLGWSRFVKLLLRSNLERRTLMKEARNLGE